MEIITLILFTGELVFCLLTGIHLVYSLVIGYLIFSAYALLKGYSLRETLSMSYDGIRTVKGILITFVLIGILTGAWRVGGTIPVIISFAVSFITSEAFYLLVFSLNCMISFLTGTSFGTAATMGAICVTMAHTLGINPVITGGAVLSGIFFGDRCSPVSTSAMLVAELTHTDLYDNIRTMFKTALVPFLMTVFLYMGLGFFTKSMEESSDAAAIFGENLILSPVCALPALLILLLAALRVKVKKTLIISTAAAVVCALWIQKVSLSELMRVLMLGFHPANTRLSAMLSGGGAVSMGRNILIVCISSSFSGIFNKTGMLKGLKDKIERLAEKITPFGALLATSVTCALVACNQTLTTMLAHDLCDRIMPDEKERAMGLENTAILVSALIPWSIAGSAALMSAGADTKSIPFGFYLYLVPLWQLVCAVIRRKKER